MISSICRDCGRLGLWNEYGFLSKILSIITEDLYNRLGKDKIILIDVGAGSLESDNYRDFITNKSNKIFICPDKDECYRRIKNKMPDRDEHEYFETEYKKVRIDIYERSSKIEVYNDNIDMSANKLKHFLEHGHGPSTF